MLLEKIWDHSLDFFHQYPDAERLCNIIIRPCAEFSAGSIEEAKKLLKQETFDLILLDINLPDGSGFDFAKETVAHQNIPFLFLTAPVLIYSYSPSPSTSPTLISLA